MNDDGQIKYTGINSSAADLYSDEEEEKVEEGADDQEISPSKDLGE